MIRHRRVAIWVVTALLCNGCASTRDQHEPFLQQLQQSAAAAYRVGDLHQAEGLWQQALQANPEVYANWCSLGQVRFRLHQYDAAAIGFQRCLEANPNQPLAWHNLAAVRLRQATESLLQGSMYLDAQQTPAESTQAFDTLLEHLLQLQRAAVKP